MADDSISRRRVLEGGTALGVAALAGCSGVTNLLPGGGGPGYTTWMPTPSALEEGDSYQFFAVDAATFAEHQDLLGDWFYDLIVSSVTGNFPIENLEAEEVDTYVSMHLAGAAETTVEFDDLVDPIEENEDYDESGRYGGYTIFMSGDGEHAVGVSGKNLAYGMIPVLGGGSARGRLKAVIDAKRGISPRYAEESERISMLSDTLGDQTFLAGWPHSVRYGHEPGEGILDGQIARGWGLDFADDKATAIFTRILKEGASISRSDAEEWIEEDPRIEPIEDPRLSVDGRIVTVRGEVDPSAYREIWD